VILRTVFMSRPSMRGSPAMMRRRTMLYSELTDLLRTLRARISACRAGECLDGRLLDLTDARVPCLLVGILYASPSAASAARRRGHRSSAAGAGAHSQAGLRPHGEFL